MQYTSEGHLTGSLKKMSADMENALAAEQQKRDAENAAVLQDWKRRRLNGEDTDNNAVVKSLKPIVPTLPEDRF